MFKAEAIRFLRMNDLLLVPVYLFLVLFFAFLIRNLTLYRSPLKKYFLPGLLVKIAGALILGAVYGFYYHGGDTFYYYYDSRTFNESFKQSWRLFFKLLALPANTVTIDTYESTYWLTYFHDPSLWTADKIYGILSILSFHSYPVMAILIATASFTGVWALYRTFTDLYPHLYRQLAFCILFVPSVFFWGSGVLKDSITFGCLGWVTYCSYLIFFKRRRIIRNTIMLLICGYIAMKIKAYIIISFLPALMFWIFLTYRSKIPNKFIRVLSGPAILLLSGVLGYIMVLKLGDEFSRFSLQNVLHTAHTFQQWHTFLAQHDNASGYSLGNLDGSWLSIIKAFPAAVNVTLFRPYLWESNSVIMLASSLESAFILCFSLYILFKNGLRRTVSITLSNPTVSFCFFFSIIFAFSVGFTSYNFGALVRYKIPCIPFYLVGLVILNHLTALQRKQVAEEKAAFNRERSRRRWEQSLPEPVPA